MDAPIPEPRPFTVPLSDAFAILMTSLAVLVDNRAVARPILYTEEERATHGVSHFMALQTEDAIHWFDQGVNARVGVDDLGAFVMVNHRGARVTIMPLLAMPVLRP